MNEEKLLSVIVPVYKVEPYLRCCVDSIRNQTYKNLQIILVDDGSPDNCGKICDEYAELDARIIVVHQGNRGLSGARNNGLRFAEGEYVAFVDSDDWLYPEMYQTLIDMIENNNLDMARCSATWTNGKEEKPILPEKDANQLITGKAVFDHYFTEFLCKVVWNAVYRREIVWGIISPEGCHSQDNYVSGRYLYRSQRMMLTDKALYYYRSNPTSITRGGNKRLLDICVCTQRLRDDLVKEENMDNPIYTKLLNRKLARELFHFVRAKNSRFHIASIKNEQVQFIVKNLDLLRAIRFRYYLYKRHIRMV